MLDLISSVVWLTLNVYFEARGEPMEGKVAVVHVVKNRCHQRGQSVVKVITASKQFSWVEADGITQRAISNINLVRDLISCLTAVWIAGAERLRGHTLGGANHYHSVTVDPYWNDNMKLVDRIGRHKFYRDF